MGTPAAQARHHTGKNHQARADRRCGSPREKRKRDATDAHRNQTKTTRGTQTLSDRLDKKSNQSQMATRDRYEMGCSDRREHLAHLAGIEFRRSPHGYTGDKRAGIIKGGIQGVDQARSRKHNRRSRRRPFDIEHLNGLDAPQFSVNVAGTSPFIVLKPAHTTDDSDLRTHRNIHGQN